MVIYLSVKIKVVNTLFHKQTRKFRKRQPWKRRRKIEVTNLTESLEKLLDNYKSCHFCFSIRSLILSLPRKCMITLWSIVNNWVTTHDVPHYSVSEGLDCV